jgi:hypothetical protein
MGILHEQEPKRRADCVVGKNPTRTKATPDTTSIFKQPINNREGESMNIIDTKTGAVVDTGYVFRRKDYQGRYKTYRLNRVGINNAELIEVKENAMHSIVMVIPLIYLAQYGLDVSIF